MKEGRRAPQATRSGPAPDRDPQLERAARLLAVRSRRAAASPFAGAYTSAFRGGGLEFEESRPYAPGDDVRHIDWNATARTGAPFLKRFRDERDQTLLLLLDVSASMGFGSAGRTKAALAAHAAALLATAAGLAGDRVGLVAFADRVALELPARRGDAHVWSVVRGAVAAAAASRGATDLAAALGRVPALVRHRAIVVVLSDFRDGALAAGGSVPGDARARLASLARRHDVVAAAVLDPREEELPASGPLRLVDAERPGRPLVIDAGRPAVRARYRAACLARQRALERRLRAEGADLVRLRSDRDPLPALVRFFQAHAGRVHGGA
jgi:uncharacterized protein (DUF58 family)